MHVKTESTRAAGFKACAARTLNSNTSRWSQIFKQDPLANIGKKTESFSYVLLAAAANNDHTIHDEGANVQRLLGTHHESLAYKGDNMTTG